MWNYVRLDGAYYLLDATFDDPVGGSPTKDYFLKGSASSSEHRPGGGFLQGFQSNFTDPALSQNDYQPGQSAASPAAENREEQKKSCRVRYSGSAGGSYEVAFGGSVGPVDNGQSVEGGSVVSVDKWGTKKLAYPINYKTEGEYFVMNFEADGSAVKELERISDLSTEVLRRMITVKA